MFLMLQASPDSFSEAPLLPQVLVVSQGLVWEAEGWSCSRGPSCQARQAGSALMGGHIKGGLQNFGSTQACSCPPVH